MNSDIHEEYKVKYLRGAQISPVLGYILNQEMPDYCLGKACDEISVIHLVDTICRVHLYIFRALGFF